jgi:hypothetical protein
LAPVFRPLADILVALEAECTKLWPNDPTKRKHGQNGKKESVMGRLAQPGLARLDADQGPRGAWLVKEEAIEAAAARPGRPPGQKVTWTVEGTLAFLLHLPAPSADPATAMRQALQAATRWSEEVITRVELIGLWFPPKEG